MHFVAKGKTQSIVLNLREVNCLLAFSSTDEKIPELHGASLLLEGDFLSAYATDGKKSVRGIRELDKDPETVWQRHTWLLPRAAMLLASRVLIDGQEAHFPLHSARCAINGFEVWSIATGGEDVKQDWVQFAQPVEANLQMNLPFTPVDDDLSSKGAVETLSIEAKYSAQSLNALKKLALAGLTPNLTLEVQKTGFLHAVTDGSTKWQGIIKPVSPTAEAAEPDDIEDDPDDALDADGNLELQPTEPKRKRRVGKSRDMTPELKTRWAKERKVKRGKGRKS